MNSPLNRAQRRAMKNAKPVVPARIIPLPTLLDEFTVFDMPQSILDQISNGAIDAAQGVPVFRDTAGVWTEIVPALEGWIFTWASIKEKLNIAIELLPLITINKRLNSNTPITRENINAAQQCLTHCRQIFRQTNRQQIIEIAKTAQLKILLETSQLENGLKVKLND